jgi:hypothetical protein
LVDDIDNDDLIQGKSYKKKLLILRFIKGPLLHG